MATSPSPSSPRLSEEEKLLMLEEMRQKNITSTKNFLTGFAKAVTTDLPGFLMDVADKLAGDTETFGEKDRSSQLFEMMTGIKTKSGSGGAEELLGGMISPTGAVGAAKAVILPAIVAGKTFKQVREAEALLDAGTDVSIVFERTGIYPGLTDDIYRSVLSDANASLKYGEGLVERQAGQGPYIGEGPGQRLSIDIMKDRTLGEVLDHPELFARVPELKDVPVTGQFGGWQSGGYSPSINKIFVGADNTEAGFKSVLLHEVQHAIQNKYGMAPGGNSEQFFADIGEFNTALERTRNVRDRLDQSPYAPEPVVRMVKDNVMSLRQADTQAFRHYKNIAGEAEARAVQTLLADQTLLPKIPFEYYDVNSLADIIPDASVVPKVDMSPTVRTIIDFVKNNPEFGKTKYPSKP